MVELSDIHSALPSMNTSVLLYLCMTDHVHCSARQIGASKDGYCDAKHVIKAEQCSATFEPYLTWDRDLSKGVLE